MKRNLLLLLLAGMFTGLAQSQDAAKLDSTVLYNFVSVTDSARSLKEHYDVYTDDGQPVHVSQFRWKDGMWVYSGERSCTYDDAGTLLSREVITADHLGDRKVEYTYDGNGNVTREVLYLNRNEGIPYQPEWVESTMKENVYDASGMLQETDLYVKVRE